MTRPIFTTLLLLFSTASIVGQQFTWTVDLPNTYRDTTHWPFVLGVASNEPGTDHVYIWSYMEPDSFSQPAVTIYYEVATDSSFSNVIDSGSAGSDSAKSWTHTFRIDNLTPDTWYWYRYHDGNGQFSVIGRTRTLPVNTNRLRLAVGSCSNIIAYYNSYALLAGREDLNAFIHLGDWAYDNLNENRSARFLDPAANIRCDETERRKRDYLHLLDPDLRKLRASYPWIMVWDNHDVQRGDPESVKDGCRRVFKEFTGQPVFDSTDLARQYRKVSFGPLVDLFVIDVQYLEDRRDSINGLESYLGTTQKAWLLSELKNSTAQWKLVGGQKLFAPFSVQGIPGIDADALTDGGKGWDSYDQERTDVLQFIKNEAIDNVMFLSGDLHFTIISDLPVDPYDSLEYDGTTGSGSVAVELLPSGISSPNADERDIPTSLNSVMVQVVKNLNPHHIHLEFMENGYGILDITTDSIDAEVWLNNIYSSNRNEWLESRQVVLSGENHWRRPATATGVKAFGGFESVSIYPNPARGELYFEYKTQLSDPVVVELTGVDGRLIQQLTIETVAGVNRGQMDLREVPVGLYLVNLKSSGRRYTESLVIQ